MIILTCNSFDKRLVLFTLFVLVSICVMAQSNDEYNNTLSPYFWVFSDNPDMDQLPLKETSVNTTIVGTIADVTVTQVYVNTGKNPLEAIYTFPMSTNAAVYGMQMKVGKRLITAKIDEKKKARQNYEKAKSEGKRVSLLEQSRPNVFSMNVSNIMVGDSIVVELKYTEVLMPESGEYSFVYPTVVGPRYSGVHDAGQDNQFVSVPYTHEGVKPTYKFDYKLTIQAAVPIRNVVCTSHKMVVDSPTLNQAVLKLDKLEINGGNRDVIVRYSLQGNEIESGMLLFEGLDENFFMLMAQPPKRVSKEDIPPREYIFIVDVSGSMWGFPMEVSKSLMRNLLLGLNPSDKFNIVLFSSNAATFRPQSVSPTQESIQEAFDFIKSGNHWSGTEVLDALNTAYALPRPEEDISRTMVILTDGYVHVEQACFEKIRNSNADANFFAFGIGRSVNRYLIEGMAFAGNGEPMVVTKEEDASVQAEKFRNYISTPVLSRIKFQTNGFKAYDVEPATVPDMMAERPILIFGKYEGKPQGTITVSGKVGRKPFFKTYDMSKVKADKGNGALRYLWARERIKYLDYLLGANGGDRAPLAQQILDLGLKYNLMTQFTSFIAIDEEVANSNGDPTQVKQALPLPDGVSDRAIRSEVGVPQALTFEEEEVEEVEIFLLAEEDAEFPGGADSLVAFIKRNLVYPEEALNNHIQGRVYVSFCIEKDGNISSIKVLRDIGGGCGAEAVRIVKMMPKWKPAKQNGRVVRSQYNMPIQFVLPY